MAIDWNLLRPQQGPGPEIASISAMLDSFAENRMRQQQAAQEQAFREKQFQAQQANIAADNARADAQMKAQAEQHAAAAAAAKAKEEQERARIFAEKALPGAQTALRDNNLQGARLAAQPYGGDVVQDYGAGEAASEAIQQRKATAADSTAAWGQLAPYGVALGGLPQQMQATAAASAQPTAEETAQMAPRYKISGPAGSVLDYSPQEAQAAEDTAGERSARTVGSAVAGMQLPYSSRVLGVAQGMARLPGAKPDEAVKAGIASGALAEGEASREKNARLRVGQQAANQSDTAAARAQSLLERVAVDTDRLVNWKDLQTMDNKTRLALGELATNHALPERDAKVLAASIFRGGVPTAGEMHELYSNLGGTADAWDRFKSNMLQGRLDEFQREQLKSSLETAANVVAERKQRALKTLNARFGQGSGFEVLGPQVNAVIQGRAVQSGVDDFPPLYNEDETGPGAVILGSRKPKGGGKKPAAAPKSRRSPEDWVKEFSQ